MLMHAPLLQNVHFQSSKYFSCKCYQHPPIQINFRSIKNKGDEIKEKRVKGITYHYSAVLILRDLKFLKGKKNKTLIIIMKIISTIFKITECKLKPGIQNFHEPLQFKNSSVNAI